MMRLLFMSPAEAEFVRVMGGRLLVLSFVRSRKLRFPLTILISTGPILRSEGVRREVRAGKYFVDFGNDLRRAIEIDGAAYHKDIVAATERDEYLAYYGWLVLHVDAKSVFTKPYKVRRAAESWLLYGTLPIKSSHDLYPINLKHPDLPAAKRLLNTPRLH